LNFSDIPIPDDVKLVLWLGDRINLALENKKVASFEFIKSIERNFKKCCKEVQYSVRNDAIVIINNMYRTNFNAEQ
jgi:hypothetical protein